MGVTIVDELDFFLAKSDYSSERAINKNSNYVTGKGGFVQTTCIRHCRDLNLR